MPYLYLILEIDDDRPYRQTKGDNSSNRGSSTILFGFFGVVPKMKKNKIKKRLTSLI